MRRSALLGAALAASLTLATPVLIGPADAAAGHAGAATTAASAAHSASSAADRKKGHQGTKLKLKRSEKGVQPGITGEKITALPGKHAKGTVKFVIKGTGFKQAHKVKIKKGKAVYKVPPLGTGDYKVKASFKNAKGKTKFEVYDSALTVNATSFTVSKSNPTFVYPQGDLNGSVRYKNKTAATGYVDLYQDGNVKGGEGSPAFLGFGTVTSTGTFDYQSFGDDVADKYAPGTYSFQGFYTPTPSFSDYVSSNLITVTVVP